MAVRAPTRKIAEADHSVCRCPAKRFAVKGTKGRRAITDNGLSITGDGVGVTVERTAWEVPEANHAGRLRPPKGFRSRRRCAASDNHRSISGNPCCTAGETSSGEVS